MRAPAITGAWAPAPFTELRRAHYRAIAADPASHFSSYTAIQSQNRSSRRDNERHYATMSLKALAALPVKDLASPDGCPSFPLDKRPLPAQRAAPDRGVGIQVFDSRFHLGEDQTRWGWDL